MRSYIHLLFLLFTISSACGQKTGQGNSTAPYKTGNCKSSFQKIKLEGPITAESIQKQLLSITANLQESRTGLKLNYVNESPGGFHYSFTQLYSGVPVYQSELKVNTDKNNTIHSLFDNTYDTRDWNLDVSAATSNSLVAIDPESGKPVLAQLVITPPSQESLVAGGKVIFQMDANCYFTQDSAVTGKVFRPDPLTSSQHFYTDIASINGTDTLHYDNNNGADAPWMDGQQQTVNFRAQFDGVHFSLQSPFVQLTNFDTFPPDVPPVTSVTPQFNFVRTQSGFQDVNAFYHISTYHNYVRGMGFNCSDSLIDIDTHAIYEDNSFFSPDYYPRRIYYGVGGVPDAEDADVVVHEYNHSVSYNAAPGSNVGLERRGLDEGFCDYSAASYSKSISTFNDQWVYNWDGHNQYWPGRVVNSTGVYPADLDGSIYDNGQMWSSTLFSINGDIGRGATDSLIIQTHYSYAQNISMANAALLLIDADTILFNGAHYCDIYERLLEHGFVSTQENKNGCTGFSGITGPVEDNFRFVQDGNSFTIYNNDAEKMVVQVLSITGQRILPLIETQDGIFNYQNGEAKFCVSTGIYLVNVTSQKGSATFKWLSLGR